VALSTHWLDGEIDRNVNRVVHPSSNKVMRLLKELAFIPIQLNLFMTNFSALASALQGGLIVGRAALSWCLKKDLNPFGLIPKDDKDTYIDEMLGYVKYSYDNFLISGMLTEFFAFYLVMV